MSSGVMGRRCYSPLVVFDSAWFDCVCLQVVLVSMAARSSQTEFHSYWKEMLARVPEKQPKFGGKYVGVTCFV